MEVEVRITLKFEETEHNREKVDLICDNLITRAVGLDSCLLPKGFSVRDLAIEFDSPYPYLNQDDEPEGDYILPTNPTHGVLVKDSSGEKWFQNAATGQWSDFPVYPFTLEEAASIASKIPTNPNREIRVLVNPIALARMNASIMEGGIN